MTEPLEDFMRAMWREHADSFLATATGGRLDRLAAAIGEGRLRLAGPMRSGKQAAMRQAPAPVAGLRAERMIIDEGAFAIGVDYGSEGDFVAVLAEHRGGHVYVRDRFRTRAANGAIAEASLHARLARHLREHEAHATWAALTGRDPLRTVAPMLARLRARRRLQRGVRFPTLVAACELAAATK
ncbi:hypothetical protein D3C72_780910 [compost metagenome]